MSHSHEWAISQEFLPTTDPIHPAICKVCGETTRLHRSAFAGSAEPNMSEWLETMERFGHDVTSIRRLYE